MARAAASGDRVVCVYATNGDHGTVPHDIGERTLIELRRAEAEASARVLGTHRIAWLGYADSGMTGWDQNSHEQAFWTAPVDDAARSLADILDAEDADIVVGYDWHGGYGHPDHIQVHRVVTRAVELAARRPRHLQVTMNRDRMRQLTRAAAEAGLSEADWDVDAPMQDGQPFGTPEAELHWAVDISEHLGQKRAALACHASQEDAAGMLLMPEEAFAIGFGIEYYIEPGRPAGMVEGWPFGAS